MSRIACNIPQSKLLYKRAEQYRKIDIIIDTVCKVSGMSWLDFITDTKKIICKGKKEPGNNKSQKGKEVIRHKKDLLRNNTVGIIALLCWEYVGTGYERKVAKLLNRSRSNMINQAQAYRKALQARINEKSSLLTQRIYDESKARLDVIFTSTSLL